MDFDPFLYLALGAGVLVGWLVRPTGPWVGRATQATIIVLLFLLGASLASVPPQDIGPSVALGLGLAALVLALTIGFALLLPRAPAMPSVPHGPRPRESVGFSVALIGALLVGYAVGSLVHFPATASIEYALYVLLFLVGLGLTFVWKMLRRLWVPLLAATLGAFVAGGIYSLATGLALRSALVITFAFGWYSLDGPLVAASLGAALGLLAFLTNFLRENLTMLLAPVLGPKVRGEGLTAMGGATAMDTTLYFVVRFGDSEAASLALTTGLVLTVAASLIVPALLLLPA